MGLTNIWEQLTRRAQPVPGNADALQAGRTTGFTFSNKRQDRMNTALRSWYAERSEADLAAAGAQKQMEDVRQAGVSQQVQKPAPQALAKPAAATAVAHVQHATYDDGSDWLPEPEPEPVRRPEPAAQTEQARQAEPEPESEPTADRDDRYTPPGTAPLSQNADYYEVMQVSPNADAETVHRVYRIMAARFHPDNPTTGSLERFLQLREAYQTLSDPALRSEYDASRQEWQSESMPVFWQKSFVDGIEGETNRRLGVLSLLYQRRRISENKPGISVMELERRMAFPREYLNFTLWYLRQKGYVARMDDNSDYSLTSAGVDFVEGSSNSNRVIRELLTAGTGGDQARTEEPHRHVVVQFPKNAARSRTDAWRRVQRRKVVGRRVRYAG